MILECMNRYIEISDSSLVNEVNYFKQKFDELFLAFSSLILCILTIEFLFLKFYKVKST